VIDLTKERPTATAFLRASVREMKIRFYQPKTVKNYRTALTGILRWFNAPPHLLTRDRSSTL
jgi:Holliday junction resolvase RusA-like endonuclease